MNEPRITDALIANEGATVLLRLVNNQGKAMGLRLKAAELWPQGTRPNPEPVEWR